MPISQLLAIGAYAPPAVLTNDDIAQFVDTSDQWIVERTGIRQRHRLDADENCSDLGFRAAKLALERAGVQAESLTHIVGATCTPDHLSPSLACIIGGKLNAGPIMAFDIGAACTGFIYGLAVSQALLAAAPQGKVLLVCAEALTRRLNWQDRSTCVLFGDAACACVLAADANDPEARLMDVICKSDGAQKYLITVGGGTSCRYRAGDPVDEGFFLSMHGRDTYRHAVRQMVSVCEEILKRNNLTMNDIDLFVPHQANMRIIEAVGARLGISAERVFTNVDSYGNTSAASIPLALWEAKASGRLGKGARVLVTAFGAGLTWGAALLAY